MNLNYLLYRTKYRFAKNLNLKAPVDVSLELSSACNMKCNYCYHAAPDKLPFTRGIMKPEVARTILLQSAELGVHSIKTNWKGESTLNPYFEEITTYAQSLAHGSTFIDRITNSNFKFDTGREDIFRGLCRQTKVKVSFDSFAEDVFHRQRAGGDHNLTLANIDKFYNYKGRNNTIVIQAVRTKLNRNEDIAGNIQKRWPSAIVSIRDMVGGRVDKDTTEYENRSRDGEERQACIQAFARIIFNWEGKAFPCCPDVSELLCIGDIKYMSVKEIWESKSATNLRCDLKDKTAFNNDPCKSCSSFETFKGFKPNWNS